MVNTYKNHNLLRTGFSIQDVQLAHTKQHAMPLRSYFLNPYIREENSCSSWRTRVTLSAIVSRLSLRTKQTIGTLLDTNELFDIKKWPLIVKIFYKDIYTRVCYSQEVQQIQRVQENQTLHAHPICN